MFEIPQGLAGLFALCLPIAAASGQPMHKATPLVGQANVWGAAGVTARLKAQGYPEVRNLRLGADGRWMARSSATASCKP